MENDPADRFSGPRALLKSWLATLHGPDLTFTPRVDGPLPAWGPLVRAALAWHVAYALMAYAGALAIARGGSEGRVAHALQSGGTPALLICTMVLWWGGVALTTALWWIKVRQLRSKR